MEHSEDKTVRSMVASLNNYQWLYQYSIFVNVLELELDEAKGVASEWLLSFDDVKFRTYLRKKNSDVGMMYILRKTSHKSHPSGKRFQQYYITIFAIDSLDGLEAVNRYSVYKCNVMNRKVTDKKIESTCNALKKQKLHDLSSLGNKHRYSLLNKSKIR